MNDAVMSLLGLARRANRLSLGFDSVCDSVRKGEAQIVLTTSDFSEGSLKKLMRCTEGCGTEHIAIPYDGDRLNAALGKAVRVISVNDGGFAKKIKLLLNGNGEE